MNNTITVPFDVNSEVLRDEFFSEFLPQSLKQLTEDASPLWGTMSAQELVEHLIRVFQCSTGKLEAECHTPENLVQRTKKFLYDERHTPHDFKNPLLGDNIPPLKYHAFADAVNSLLKEIEYFVNYYRENPLAIHIHPLFGALGAEEWERTHFKHSYHHMLQFGVIHY